MGLNNAFNRSLWLIGGGVRTSGGSNQLTNGQLAVVDTFESNSNGSTILSSFLGIPKNKKSLEIQVGGPAIEPNRSFSNLASATAPFSLENIKGIRSSAPTRTEQVLQEFILGYNGFDDSTAFQFKKGQSVFNVSLSLKGGALQYRGGATNNEIVTATVHVPACDPYETCTDCDECGAVDCKAIVLEAIEQLKTHQLSSGKPASEFVDITPVFGGCDNTPTPVLIPYVYYTLEVCDTGDSEALALVAAQYGVPVIRIARNGSQSVYQMLLPETSGAPASYVQSIGSILKGCSTCPDGYNAVENGFVYAITIADGSVDSTSVITASLATSKLVSGTVIKSGNDNGIGFYTAIYSSKLTAAEISSFVNSTSNFRNTATVAFVRESLDFCSNSSTTTTAWVEGDTCNATSQTYSLVLPDDTCGDSRLEEVQAAYSENTIEVAMSDNYSRTITLTGSSGAATVTIDGDAYTATYATSLTVTGANFVTTNAAAILAAAGVTVTAAAGVITLEGPQAIIAGATIANASGNLNGTTGARVAVTLTGTSGTANVNVNGTDYLATFATNLTTTASNFVTAHATALLADGIVVTSSAAVLTFVGLTDLVTGVTVTNATTDLAGTVGSISGSYFQMEDRRNCSTRYTTTVISNLVCDECSPVFLDYYKTDAPRSFGVYQWTLDADQEVNPNTNCLCGIRVRSRSFLLSADEALRDVINFEESAVEIDGSAMFPGDIREGIGYIPQGVASKYWVQPRNIARTHLYGNARDIENESRAHFRGTHYQNNYLTRLLLDETSAVRNNVAQYAVYYLRVGFSNNQSSFGSIGRKDTEYAIYVELGRHSAVETLLNNLVAAAGHAGTHVG